MVHSTHALRLLARYLDARNVPFERTQASVLGRCGIGSSMGPGSTGSVPEDVNAAQLERFERRETLVFLLTTSEAGYGRLFSVDRPRHYL